MEGAGHAVFTPGGPISLIWDCSDPELEHRGFVLAAGWSLRGPLGRQPCPAPACGWGFLTDMVTMPRLGREGRGEGEGKREEEREEKFS